MTLNTDFAQVEADEQQVNLTRFSLFFPEKREFFLENQGLFAFGGAGAGLFGGGGSTPVLFYSRRIGLEDGREVPLDVGGRLTGRIGAFSVGALTIRTGAEPVSATPATTFTAIRLKRDVLRRSSIGAIVTRRSVSTKASGSNETYGLDGTFGFYDNVSLNTYWAKTQTQGVEDDVSYRAQFDYAGDRYGVEVERLVVGAGFNPEVGFLRRDDFERTFGSVRFSPRPRSITAIRKFSWSAQIEYITDRAGVLETREAEGRFGIELENGDTYDLSYTPDLRVSRAAVSDCPRGDDPGRRLQFPGCTHFVLVRVPAPAGGAALGHQLGAGAQGVDGRGARQCGDRARRPQQGLDGVANSVNAAHDDDGHGTDPTAQHAISSRVGGLPSFSPWACVASWYGQQAVKVFTRNPFSRVDEASSQHGGCSKRGRRRVGSGSSSRTATPTISATLRTYEFLEQPFPIAPGVTIPVGGYSFQDVRTSYSFGSQRRLAGRLSAISSAASSAGRRPVSASGSEVAGSVAGASS